MNKDKPAYIARCACGAIMMACVAEDASENSKEIADCLKKGYSIHRTTVGEAKADPQFFVGCTCGMT